MKFKLNCHWPTIQKLDDFFKVLFNIFRLYRTSAPAGGHKHRDRSWSRLRDQITPTEDMQGFEELSVVSFILCRVPLRSLNFLTEEMAGNSEDNSFFKSLVFLQQKLFVFRYLVNYDSSKCLKIL